MFYGASGRVHDMRCERAAGVLVVARGWVGEGIARGGWKGWEGTRGWESSGDELIMRDWTSFSRLFLFGEDSIMAVLRVSARCS